MTIAISGASGHLGKATAELALEAAGDQDVVLLTRSPAKLSDLASKGAIVREADFNDQAKLADALDGVGVFLLISTDAIGQRVAQHQAAYDAAKAAGVGRIVYTSFVKPEPGNPSLVTPEQYETEQILINGDLPYTILRNGMYTENQLDSLAGAIAGGVFYTNSGEGVQHAITRQDTAAAAVAALLNEGHENKTYTVVGEQGLTVQDLAAVASEVSGKEISVVHVDDEAAKAGMVAAGLPEHFAGIYTSIGQSVREGYAEAENDHFEQLVGRKPQDTKAALKQQLAEKIGSAA